MVIAERVWTFGPEIEALQFTTIDPVLDEKTWNAIQAGAPAKTIPWIPIGIAAFGGLALILLATKKGEG